MDFAFILKKLLSAGLTPVAIVIEVSLLGILLIAYSRRLIVEKPSSCLLWIKGKAGDIGSFLICSAILFLYLCSIETISQPLSGLLERQYPILENAPNPPDYIVVLPGYHRYWGGKPAESKIERKTFQRLIRGINYWQQYPQATIVFSGLPMEVETMADISIQMGVPSEQIFQELEAKDTKDHPRYLKPLLTGKTFLLVTSGNHMPRSVRLFEGQDLSPIPAPCDIHYAPFKPFSMSKLIPRARNLLVTDEAIHEGLGLAWAALRNQSK